MSFDPAAIERLARIRDEGKGLLSDFLAQRQSKATRPLDDQMPEQTGDEGEAETDVSSVVRGLIPQQNTKIYDVWPAAYEAPRLIKPKKIIKAPEPVLDPPPSLEELADRVRKQGPLLLTSVNPSGEKEIVAHRWSVMTDEEKETLMQVSPPPQRKETNR